MSIAASTGLLRSRSVRIIVCGLALAGLLGVALRPVPATAGELAPQSTPPYTVFLPLVSKIVQPNFIIIISDDQRYDTIDYMPLTKSRLFDSGVTFRRAYVTTPLCCPSRSSILTGLYALHHNVYTNFTPLDKTTFVQRLHAAGYYTGIVGKYLNSWDGTPRPEFDSWVVFAGHGSAQHYFDPLLNVNGAWQQHAGYMTDILKDYALSFLDQARRQPKPFLLIFAPNTPHEPADPAPGDEHLYPDLPPYRPPSFMEADLSDKPQWLQGLAPAAPSYIDSLRRRQLRTLHSLDVAINALLDALADYGPDSKTVVMYISDNGVFWGEHGLNGKTYPYLEATHVPFAIRYDPLTSQPRAESRLVANIDIAPTLYELAGLSIPPETDGRSLVPLLKQQDTDWRDSLLVEGWGYYPYAAIQTERYLYIETDGDISELYDSTSDPYQMQNQAGNPAYAAVVDELHHTLLGFKSQRSQPALWETLIFSLVGLDD
ncbi:MAG TPA: sulfatase-like hydrolase/transferase [Anaerolineae bacterium]